MNFALPTAAIILGLIPGILFRSSYFAGRFPRQVYGTSPIAELAQYIFLALLINTPGVYLVSKFFKGNENPIRLETLVRVLTGQFSENSIESVANTLGNDGLSLVFGYLLVVAGSVLLAITLRRIVWTFRLDVRWSPLRMKHSWYYTLQGRLPNFPRQVIPVADIIAEHPSDGSRLYRGIVTDFTVTRTGEIAELILVDAQRGRGRDNYFQWVDVPGDQIILFGSKIHSVNMRYASVDPPDDRWDRLMWGLRIYLRSFFLEEP